MAQIGDKLWECTIRLRVGGGYTNSYTMTGSPATWKHTLTGIIQMLEQWASKLHEQEQ